MEPTTEPIPTPPTSFGLDLDGRGGASPCPIEEALARQGVWVNVRVHADHVEEESLAAAFPTDVVAALTADETRPRVAVVADGLLLVVRGVNLNAGADPEDMVSLRLWYRDGHLVTTQRRRLMAIGDLEGRLVRGEGASSTAGLVLELVERLLERMSPTLEALDERVDALEDQAESGRPSDVLRDLADLRRRAIALRRHVAPTRDALAQLAVLAPRFLGEGTEWSARELADQVARYVDDLDEVRDRAQIAQEFILTRQNDQLNRRMMVLSLVAAVFLPLGLVSGLLGMNVGGVPLASSPDGFFLVCAGLVVVGALQVGVLKFMRWI